MSKIALTGIKPSGNPHIGNYLGSIQPALSLVNEHQALYFVADYHAMTTAKDPEQLSQLTYEVAAAWLTLGLDPSRTIFYRQSDIPEILELTWILSCSTAKGLLNRAHAYKAAVSENEEAGRDPDEGVNAGLYSYPVLMAADILLFKADVVPVGSDQKQHVEIARDIASSFNYNYGEILRVPEPLLDEEVKTIPGLDGRKMSKSYDNTIPIFASPQELRKRVFQIVTDSKPPEELKEPDQNNIFNIYKHFAAPEDITEMRHRYLNGGLGYAEAKQALYDLLMAYFAEARTKYTSLMDNKQEIDHILFEGAEKARSLAIPYLEEIRQATGIRRIR
jgi:tryptophanyl-tRNA synthetase